jgi:DNA-binding NarL/FixJ family response regulator
VRFEFFALESESLRRGASRSTRLTRRDPRAKVIVITGMLDDAVRVRALAAGASAVMPKVTAAHDLIDEIKRGLRSVHLTGESYRAVTRSRRVDPTSRSA